MYYMSHIFTELAIYYREGGLAKVMGNQNQQQSSTQELFAQMSSGYSLAWLRLLLKSAALKIF